MNIDCFMLELKVSTWPTALQLTAIKCSTLYVKPAPPTHSRSPSETNALVCIANNPQPYDCGMFFTRTPSILQSVCVNPNAAYLASGAVASIPSPLNVGLENSRRFRALPAYAALLSQGRPGYAKLCNNMAQLSRKLAIFLRESPHYELLPDESADVEEVFIIVLFRAKDRKLNDELVAKINATRQMYVSGTSWKGEKAVRVAVSNWMVDIEREFRVVSALLTAVAEGREFDIEKV